MIAPCAKYLEVCHNHKIGEYVACSKCMGLNMNKNGVLTCSKILGGDIWLRYCLLRSCLIMCREKWAKRPCEN